MSQDLPLPGPGREISRFSSFATVFFGFTNISQVRSFILQTTPSLKIAVNFPSYRLCIHLLLFHRYINFLLTFLSLTFRPTPATFGSPPGVFNAARASGGLTNHPGGLSGQAEGPEPHPRPAHPHGIPGVDGGKSTGKQTSQKSANEPILGCITAIHSFHSSL